MSNSIPVELDDDHLPLPHPPSRRHSHSASLAPQQRLRGASLSAKRSMSMSAASTLPLSDWEEDDDEDENEEEDWERGRREEEMQMGQGAGGAGRKRKKREEPMSPVVVVLYVIALYLIFQILTRSDDHEILSHLPPTSSILHSPKSPLDLQQYHLPYQFPHLPNPMPSIPPSSSTSPSIWRTIANILVYPVYLAVALVVTPLPFLLVGLRLLLELIGTILYPLTVTGRILFRTFVKGPWGLFVRILEIFYPVYVFVGGVLGVGCVLGLGAGWVGKVILDSLLRWKDGKRKTKRGSTSTTTSTNGTPERYPNRPIAVGSGRSKISKPRRSDLPTPLESARIRSRLYTQPQRLPRERERKLPAEFYTLHALDREREKERESDLRKYTSTKTTEISFT
ncbi:hypothetical protein CI109_102470 [Kwoniella shandongensis]|uniref:Uncharacterized protein n=1 Tax=Kwoniella shandongensis TaxID=1734106 RepID=A0A5M6BZX5_9TREE|nr:uncharacterized protein CI109_003211 [Kwoniella shandongensis]KAA5528313.1 hypothetical protein CI109_003211 [Kwoniella shandongensis]